MVGSVQQFRAQTQLTAHPSLVSHPNPCCLSMNHLGVCVLRGSPPCPMGTPKTIPQIPILEQNLRQAPEQEGGRTCCFQMLRVTRKPPGNCGTTDCYHQVPTQSQRSLPNPYIHSPPSGRGASPASPPWQPRASLRHPLSRCSRSRIRASSHFCFSSAVLAIHTNHLFLAVLWIFQPLVTV